MLPWLFHTMKALVFFSVALDTPTRAEKDTWPALRGATVLATEGTATIMEAEMRAAMEKTGGELKGELPYDARRRTTKKRFKTGPTKLALPPRRSLQQQCTPDEE